MNFQTVSGGESSVVPDAISLLTQDHRKARQLFERYESMKDDDKPEGRFEIAKEVCGDILIHMAIEEAIFYPAVRQSINDEEMVNEAQAEHDAAKDLIRELGEIKPDEPMFDAKMKVLSEQIEHHVQEEELSMFPKVLLSDLDIDALGKTLHKAKNDMRTSLGLLPE